MNRVPVVEGFRVDGKVAVVTGGTSGIGRACAEVLAAAGADVFVVDRQAAEDRSGPQTIQADIADPAAVVQAIETISTRSSGIDILVNSAGTAIRKPAVELSVDDWNTVVSVNMTGSFLCSREVARGMIERGTGGAIVNVASIMGLSGGGLYPNISYQTTKGAIINMTRALAVEWAPYAIRVNAVAPTYVNTPFISALTADPELVERIKDLTPLRRLAEPREVAAAVLFLASGAAGMVTGHTLPVDGGFLAQ